MTQQAQPKSKFKATIALAITAIPILIGGALLATNPSKERYTDYAVNQLCAYPDLPEPFAAQFETACQDSGLWGRDALKSGISSQTERKNYYFFSTYKTSAFDRSISSVGVFGQFFPIGMK